MLKLFVCLFVFFAIFLERFSELGKEVVFNISPKHQPQFFNMEATKGETICFLLAGKGRYLESTSFRSSQDVFLYLIFS